MWVKHLGFLANGKLGYAQSRCIAPGFPHVENKNVDYRQA